MISYLQDKCKNWEHKIILRLKCYSLAAPKFIKLQKPYKKALETEVLAQSSEKCSTQSNEILFTDMKLFIMISFLALQIICWANKEVSCRITCLSLKSKITSGWGTATRHEFHYQILTCKKPWVCPVLFPFVTVLFIIIQKWSHHLPFPPAQKC